MISINLISDSSHYLLSDIGLPPSLFLITDSPSRSLYSEPLSPSPLGWLLNPDKGDSLTERVLARLIQSEAHEPDVWLRDDYRQAFITLSLAAQNSPIPFVEASYIMYGLHPEKLYASILARRSALLGPTGEALPQNPQKSRLPGSSPFPRKSVSPVGTGRKERAA